MSVDVWDNQGGDEYRPTTDEKVDKLSGEILIKPKKNIKEAKPVEVTLGKRTLLKIEVKYVFTSPFDLCIIIMVIIMINCCC